jgi:hypothetical protein
MPIPLPEDAEYWRMRAKEARVLAEQLKDEHSKNIMRGIANEYERMAEMRMASLALANKAGFSETAFPPDARS